MIYNLDIETLITELAKLVDKGITQVQLEGTLYCIADGNSIIASNIPQI